MATSETAMSDTEADVENVTTYGGTSMTDGLDTTVCGNNEDPDTLPFAEATVALGRGEVISLDAFQTPQEAPEYIIAEGKAAAWDSMMQFFTYDLKLATMPPDRWRQPKPNQRKTPAPQGSMRGADAGADKGVVWGGQHDLEHEN